MATFPVKLRYTRHEVRYRKEKGADAAPTINHAERSIPNYELIVLYLADVPDILGIFCNSAV